MVDIYPILQVLIVAVIVPIAAILIWRFTEKHGILDMIDAHKELATIAVKMVAVTYDTLSGPEKLEKAVEALSKMLKERGIHLSPEEIKGLAQDAYDRWMQEWKELEEDREKIEQIKVGKYI